MPYFPLMNSNLVRRWKDIFAFYGYSPNVPEVMSTVQINDAIAYATTIVRDGQASDATSATIYTTENAKDKDFYVSAVQLNVTGDVTSTATLSSVTATIDGTARRIFSFFYTGGTNRSIQNSISFPFPIKIDKNTAITVTNNTATANIDAVGTIYGFYANTHNNGGV